MSKIFVQTPLLLISILMMFSIVVTPVSAESKVTETGNRYEANDTVDIDNDVTGDLVSIGEEIQVNGKVEDNAVMAGRTILVDEEILGDLWVAGGYVVINGNLLGDARIIASKVYINSEVIRGDLTVFAEEVSISDKTEIFGEEILEVSKERRNVTDNPTDLTNADDEIGDFSENFSDFTNSFSGALSTIGFIASVIMFLGGIILSYFIIKVFPVFTEDTLVTIQKDFLKAGGIGFTVLLLGPIVAILLLISLVGIKLMLFLVLLAILATTVSQTLARYLLGRLILKRMGKDKTGRLIPLLVGALILGVYFFVLGILGPIGGLISFISHVLIISVGVGAISLNKKRALI